jgi:hypothetical protein
VSKGEAHTIACCQRHSDTPASACCMLTTARPVTLALHSCRLGLPTLLVLRVLTTHVPSWLQPYSLLYGLLEETCGTWQGLTAHLTHPPVHIHINLHAQWAHTETGGSAGNVLKHLNTQLLALQLLLAAHEVAESVR